MKLPSSQVCRWSISANSSTASSSGRSTMEAGRSAARISRTSDFLTQVAARRYSDDALQNNHAKANAIRANLRKKRIRHHEALAAPRPVLLHFRKYKVPG